MCGICGIINFNNQTVEEHSIKKMMQKQKHRGPDDEGIFIDNNIGLGFVRLSILDLTPAGHQPMYSKDNRYVIVFNGEVYNYLELKEELKHKYDFTTGTDTEVVLAAYQEWGQECLHKFNGMWSFAIYDTLKKTVLVSRDRYGIKPFYYYVDDNHFIFASEIPPILDVMNKRPTPDNETIFEYLVFNRTDQTERTFFKEIKKLQHGNILEIQNNKVKIEEWYNLRKTVANTQGFSTPDEFKHLFSDSIKLRLRSDVPVGVCLSGGLDSSSIVSVLLSDFNKKDLKTFSAVYKKGQYGDESEFISEYKKLIDNMYYTNPNADSLIDDYNNFIIAHGEPVPSTSPYAQFKVMELAKNEVTVILDGQGADEELAGYHYFFGFFFKDLLLNCRIIKLIREIVSYISIHKSLMGVKSFIFFLLPKFLRTIIRVKEKGYLNKEFYNQNKNVKSIAGNLYGSKSLKDSLLDHFEFKLEHLLKWDDRNSMFFSLESRLPFLDYRLVEKLLATSEDLKIKNGQTKHILREAMENILPKKIQLRQDKVGFGNPSDEWFRESEWQKIIEEIISSDSFKQRNIIDCSKAMDLYRRHLNKDINISKEIWKWINLELWFREFIDK